MLQGAAFCELTTRTGLCTLLNGLLTHFPISIISSMCYSRNKRKANLEMSYFKFFSVKCLTIYFNTPYRVSFPRRIKCFIFKMKLS